jgi:hypothetical protein
MGTIGARGDLLFSGEHGPGDVRMKRFIKGNGIKPVVIGLGSDLVEGLDSGGDITFLPLGCEECTVV